MNEGGVALALIGLLGTVIGSLVWLLKFVMNENAKRETKYQELLNVLANKFDGIKDSVDKLRNDFDKKLSEVAISQQEGD